MNDTRNAVEEINLEKVRKSNNVRPHRRCSGIIYVGLVPDLIFIPSFPLSLLGALIRRTGLMAGHA